MSRVHSDDTMDTILTKADFEESLGKLHSTY